MINTECVSSLNEEMAHVSYLRVAETFDEIPPPRMRLETFWMRINFKLGTHRLLGNRQNAANGQVVIVDIMVTGMKRFTGCCVWIFLSNYSVYIISTNMFLSQYYVGPPWCRKEAHWFQCGYDGAYVARVSCFAIKYARNDLNTFSLWT